MVAKTKQFISIFIVTLVVALFSSLPVDAQSAYGENSYGACDYSSSDCEASGDLSNTGQEALWYVVGGVAILASAVLLYFVGKKSKSS